MGFFSKGREERKVAKAAKKAMKEDPLFRVKLNREVEIMNDCVSILSSTNNLSTLTGRYETASVHVILLNDLLIKIGDASCVGFQDDIDKLFVERLPVAVDFEIHDAGKLKTSSGRSKRLNTVIDVLERCDRVEGSAVDEAIQEAESGVFRAIESETDWPKEQDVDISISEDFIVSRIKKAARQAAVEKGMSGKEVDETIKKVFRK